ncbi:MAG: TlpA disulfide reductase family protein [Prevotellaceae bacterium]|nr:TlpA disulfide reductase family protein [Prevotellaceae bacterium]
MNIRKLLSATAVVAVAFAVTACQEKKFHVEGTIANAKDSTLYFESMSLQGPVAVDSVKLDDGGEFSFSSNSPEAPEFYRLRIAGQIINIAIDSTETVNVKATMPDMARNYEVSGSEECSKIRTLAIKQIDLQNRAIAIERSPELGSQAVADSINKLLREYKEEVKRDFIFKEPKAASSYFALFQAIGPYLIFNPRTSKDDIKVFAAVATSWDTFYPGAERGQNLHNIAIEGMKNERIVAAGQQTAIDASKVSEAGIINIKLRDNKGVEQSLTQLKGKVVLLDFHIFAMEDSPKRILMLRELYNKYHAQGLEIYQVSLDTDEHFWKQQTSALPWISVIDPASVNSQNLALYNVQSVPDFFLIDKSNTLVNRAARIKDLDAAIAALL